MRFGFNLETVKIVAGAAVVVAALCIMLPGFLMVGAGLLRIAVIIVIAGGACLGLAHLTRRMVRMKGEEGAAGKTPPAAGPDI